MADGDGDDKPEYGSAPVPPSLAWTHVKLDEIKTFMKIDKVTCPRNQLSVALVDQILSSHILASCVFCCNSFLWWHQK